MLPAPQPRPRHRQTSESHPRQLRAMLREACCPILPSNIRKVRLTRVYTTTPRPTPETPPPSSTATRRRRIAGEQVRPRGPRLARRRRGLGPGRGVGNARSRVRGGWKRRIAPCRNPSSTTHLAACKTLGKQTKRALTATHQKVNRLTHHIHIPAKILVRPDPTTKASWRPPTSSKMQP